MRNPIMPGSFPDPSILRVGEDYYLCNSSFEYFPGLPIHHSKDLVTWSWVGYGLHRPEQVQGDTRLTTSDAGVQAPSIRYHDGTFYIIACTIHSVDGRGILVNFVITASDVRGPWSMPHVFEGADGIDPDIFFDDDGTVWYVGTHPPPPEKRRYDGEGVIYTQQIDLTSWKLVGERYDLWSGTGGTFAEGPHIYKRNGKYYLVVAEGGTGVNHSVTVAVASKIIGDRENLTKTPPMPPYKANERNPILTSRNQSYNNWVHSTGHGDIVELPDGRFYMVCLGVRGDVEYPDGTRRASNMGRETHIVPVVWERVPIMNWTPERELWPVCAPDTGRVERTLPVPFTEAGTWSQDTSFFDDFDGDDLHYEWNFRRVPLPNTYSLDARKGFLRLLALPEVIKDGTSYSWVGIRQRESDFTYRAEMDFRPQHTGAEAGVCFIQKDNRYLRWTVLYKQEGYILQLVLAEAAPNGLGPAPEAIITTLQTEALNDFKGKIRFVVTSANDRYTFSYSQPSACSKQFSNVFGDIPGNKILSQGGFQGGYTGAYLGLYCSANGKSTDDYADFDCVEHVPHPRV